MDEIKNTIQPVLDKLKELEPPPQEVMQEVTQQENITATQPMQTQDNNTTPPSASTPAPVTEEQTVDSGII